MEVGGYALCNSSRNNIFLYLFLDLIRIKEFYTCLRFLTDKWAFPNATFAAQIEPLYVSRDQIVRHKRGQGNIHFSCSADHGQDWQPYPVDS